MRSPERAVAALRAPAAAKRMLVIVNPYATTMSEKLRHLVVYALQGRYDVDAVDTQRRGHAIELCREAAQEGYDVVVAFGGDGTVNEAANGLVGSATVLTALPGGSNNVFAKLLGIPADVVDATEHLLALADDWQPRKVDLGVVNGRYFTFAAGMGLDAAVVERVDAHPKLKSRFGPAYYIESAVATFVSQYALRPPRISVEVGGQRLDGVSAFFQNAPHYTYIGARPVTLAAAGALDSGTLAGLLLRRARAYDTPSVTLRALLGPERVARHGSIATFPPFTTALLRSTDGRPVPLHVDGDHIGDELEARLGIVPGALSVIA